MFRAACKFNVLFGAILLSVASGCMSIPEMCGYKAPPLPPPPAKEILAMPKDEIIFVQDSVNNQRPLPGLMARIHLFSEGLKPVMLEANGELKAELWDMTPGVQPVMLTGWNYDKESLKKLKQDDFVGMGYTVFFPWEAYNAKVKRVQMRIWYMEPGKQPIYTEQVMMLKMPYQRETPPIEQISSIEVPAYRANLPTPTPR